MQSSVDAALQVFGQGFVLLLASAPFEEILLVEATHGERQEAAELAQDELHAPPAVEHARGDHLDHAEHVVE
jgi:hypothetical protein